MGSNPIADIYSSNPPADANEKRDMIMPSCSENKDTVTEWLR